MGIIIKKENDEYWLYHIIYSYIVMAGKIETLNAYMQCGRIQDMKGLESEIEYKDLNWDKDFKIVKRIKQVKHKDGLVYDDCYYELIKEIIMMKCPICGVGENSKAYGGNEKCFHCGICGFVECECFYPDAENPIKEILDMIESRLIKLQKYRNDGKIKISTIDEIAKEALLEQLINRIKGMKKPEDDNCDEFCVGLEAGYNNAIDEILEILKTWDIC